MKNVCAKCKDDAKDGDILFEGGIGYIFCRACSDVIRFLPTNSIQAFMGQKYEKWAKNHRNRKESVVDRNIRLARERRTREEKILA
jgi:hypothetical protein